MPFDFEVGSFPNFDQLGIRDTDIDIHDTMTFFTRQVVMMIVPTCPVSMASIGKFNPVQQSHVDQHLNGPENSGTAQAGVELLQIAPEILHAEILTAGSQLRKAGSNPIPWLGFTMPFFFKGGTDFFGDGCRIAYGIHR